jgi:uncharacterized protein
MESNIDSFIQLVEDASEESKKIIRNDIKLFNRGDDAKEKAKPFLEATQTLIGGGNTHAMCLLGRAHKKGKLVDQNYSKAIELFKMAADMNDIDGFYYLAIMYIRMHTNQKKTLKYLKKCVNLGHIKSIYRLGKYYMSVHTWIEIKFDEGIVLLKKALDKGYHKAGYYLGCAYEFGRGVRKNHKKAIEFYQNAIDANVSKAYYSLGSMYMKGNGVAKNYKIAIDFFEIGVEKDDIYSMYELGWIYKHNEGFLDLSKAIKLHEMILQKNVNDIYKLIQMYDCEWRSDKNKNIDKLHEIYQICTEKGHIFASYHFATLQKKNEQKFLELTQKSADGGYNSAMYRLGIHYEDKKNYLKAAKFFQLGTDNGNYRSMYRLGNLYANGIGVVKNILKALELYKMAVDIAVCKESLNGIRRVYSSQYPAYVDEAITYFMSIKKPKMIYKTYGNNSERMTDIITTLFKKNVSLTEENNKLREENTNMKAHIDASPDGIFFREALNSWNSKVV